MLDDVGGQVLAPRGDENRKNEWTHETRKGTLVVVGLVAKGQGREARRRGARARGALDLNAHSCAGEMSCALQHL